MLTQYLYDVKILNDLLQRIEKQKKRSDREKDRKKDESKKKLNRVNDRAASHRLSHKTSCKTRLWNDSPNRGVFVIIRIEFYWPLRDSSEIVPESINHRPVEEVLLTGSNCLHAKQKISSKINNTLSVVSVMWQKCLWRLMNLCAFLWFLFTISTLYDTS